MLSSTAWFTWMGASRPRAPGFQGAGFAARAAAELGPLGCIFVCTGRTMVGGGLALEMMPAYDGRPETELGVLVGGGGCFGAAAAAAGGGVSICGGAGMGGD